MGATRKHCGLVCQGAAISSAYVAKISNEFHIFYLIVNLRQSPVKCDRKPDRKPDPPSRNLIDAVDLQEMGGVLAIYPVHDVVTNLFSQLPDRIIVIAHANFLETLFQLVIKIRSHRFH